MKDEVSFFNQVEPFLPYLTSILCSLIAGFASYFMARKNAKADMEKLDKQHTLDIQKEQEKFKMEKEKMELQHKHQLELLQAQFGNQLGADFISTLTKEYARSPAGQAQMRNAGHKKHK